MPNRRLSIGASAMLLSGALLVAWVMTPGGSAGPCAVVQGPVIVRAIPEASGLAVSRRTPGLLWSHNDSGNATVLFALSSDGTLHREVRVPVRTRDWEDVSAARCASTDCLYIADIGDNEAERQHVQIYRVAEPAAGEEQTASPEVFSATYADGPHNAEALFVVDSDLFIVTRDRRGGVYRAAIPPSGSRDLTFQRIAWLELEAVTDAEASTDQKSVVVRTPHEAVLYRTDELTRGGTVAPYSRIPIDGLREAQGEGVALDGNMLFLSSEGRRGGSLIALRCDLPQ